MMDLGYDNLPVPTEDGRFVSEKHARISELITQYDPDLSLNWIPPERREPGDQPFAVVHRPLGRKPYVVCYADECDERLLARVLTFDAKNGNVLDGIDKHNAAVRLLQLKKHEEELAESHDLARSILRSKKNVYRHDGVVYRD